MKKRNISIGGWNTTIEFYNNRKPSTKVLNKWNPENRAQEIAELKSCSYDPKGNVHKSIFPRGQTVNAVFMML